MGLHVGVFLQLNRLSSQQTPHVMAHRRQYEIGKRAEILCS